MADEDLLDLAAQLPAAEDVTLLFKHHKSTTLLSVSITLSFPEIKARLLAVLRSRGVETLPHTDIPLPASVNDIEFGVLADRKDPSKGWVPLEVKEQEVTDTKGGKRKIGGKKSVLNENAVGAGLSDGIWIAYRVKYSKAKGKSTSDGGAAELDIDIDIDMEDDPEWDVVIPSFDDEGE